MADQTGPSFKERNDAGCLTLAFQGNSLHVTWAVGTRPHARADLEKYRRGQKLRGSAEQCRCGSAEKRALRRLKRETTGGASKVVAGGFLMGREGSSKFEKQK